MFSWYELLVFVHILAAMVWLGGGIVMQVLGLRLGKNPDIEHLEQFFSIADWVSPRVFMPSAIVTLLSGLTLVFVGGADFKDLWIILALVGVALTILIGATMLGPTVARITQMLKDHADVSVIASAARRLRIITRIDIAILLLVLLDMVMKPYL